MNRVIPWRLSDSMGDEECKISTNSDRLDVEWSPVQVLGAIVIPIKAAMRQKTQERLILLKTNFQKIASSSDSLSMPSHSYVLRRQIPPSKLSAGDESLAASRRA